MLLTSRMARRARGRHAPAPAPMPAPAPAPHTPGHAPVPHTPGIPRDVEALRVWTEYREIERHRIEAAATLLIPTRRRVGHPGDTDDVVRTRVIGNINRNLGVISHDVGAMSILEGLTQEARVAVSTGPLLRPGPGAAGGGGGTIGYYSARIMAEARVLVDREDVRLRAGHPPRIMDQEEKIAWELIVTELAVQDKTLDELHNYLLTAVPPGAPLPPPSPCTSCCSWRPWPRTTAGPSATTADYSRSTDSSSTRPIPLFHSSSSSTNSNPDSSSGSPDYSTDGASGWSHQPQFQFPFQLQPFHRQVVVIRSQLVLTPQ